MSGASATDEGPARPKVLVTGAAGRVGQAVVPLLRPHLSLRLLDRRRLRADGDDEVVRADIRRQRAMVRACTGMDAVVHLAAEPNDAPFRRRLLPHNIEGTYSVFEAARQAGVAKVVFASSGQVVARYSPDTAVTTDMPPRPLTPYACTKVFGEAVGRFYADAHGMSVVCLRIGWYLPSEQLITNQRADLRRRWVSAADLGQAVVRSVLSDVPFAVVFVVSDNDDREWDLEGAHQLLGYRPRDRAERPTAPA